MRVQRILDGKIVQTELSLNKPEKILARLVQPDPDEMPRLFAPDPRLVERDLGDPTAATLGC